MIVNDNSAKKRLESPMNLINRLKNLSNGNGNDKRKNAMSLFCGNGDKKEKLEKEIRVHFNPFETQSSETEEPKPQAPQVSLTVSTPTTPILDEIIENNETQIKLGLAHDKALDLLNNSVNALAAKLDDVKADKLPAVIATASKVVESIRRERSEAAKNGKDREVHYHFYTPEQQKVSNFEIIDVG